MIIAIVAMMMFGTMSMNAQGFYRHDNRDKKFRKEFRVKGNRWHKMDRHHGRRMYRMAPPPPPRPMPMRSASRQVIIVERTPVPPPPPRHYVYRSDGRVIAAAATGAVLATVLLSMAK